MWYQKMSSIDTFCVFDISDTRLELQNMTGESLIIVRTIGSCTFVNFFLKLDGYNYIKVGKFELYKIK